MPQNISGGTRDCDGLDEKAHQGSKVEKVRKRYENRWIVGIISKMYMNGLHHIGGVQKGRNSDTYSLSMPYNMARTSPNSILIATY